MSKIKDTGWAKETVYADKEDRRISEFEQIDGPKRGQKTYVGFVRFEVKLRPPHPNMPPQIQTVPLNFDFPEGKNLDWCRKNFDNAASAAIDQWRKDQEKAYEEAMKKAKEQSKIVTPGAQPKGTILDSTGRKAT
jgi:hypothetical protein